MKKKKNHKLIIKIANKQLKLHFGRKINFFEKCIKMLNFILSDFLPYTFPYIELIKIGIIIDLLKIYLVFGTDFKGIFLFYAIKKET